MLSMVAAPEIPKLLLFSLLVLSLLLRRSRGFPVGSQTRPSRLSRAVLSHLPTSTPVLRTCPRVQCRSSINGVDAAPLLRAQSDEETSEDDDFDERDIAQYGFWDEPLSINSFNMDLDNIAMQEAQKAQDVLEIMEEMYEREQTEAGESSSELSSPLYIKPNAASYTTVINGWVHSGMPNAAQNALNLLEKMENKYDETGDEAIKPNVVTFMLTCQALAEDTDNIESAERAEDILQRMTERGMAPDVRICATVLNAWSKRAGNFHKAMQKAEELLTKLEEMDCAPVDEDDPPSEPHACVNVISYTTLINGFALSDAKDSASRAEKLLSRMEEHGVAPDVMAYNSVLNAWAKSTSKREKAKAAAKAMSLLGEMERLYLTGEHEDLKPTSMTYSICINAIAKSEANNKAELAEEVLRHMYDVTDSGGIDGIKPDHLVWNAVIVALARSDGLDGRNARRAEQLLVEMARRSEGGEADVRPNVRTWAGVILAWADCGQPNAAENAQRILDVLEKLHSSGATDVRANAVCYTTVMRAWITSKQRGAIAKAEALLRRMESLYGEDGDVDVRPTVVSYITMLNAFARDGDERAAERAEETVERMLELHATGLGYVQPTRGVFNALIKAWAKSGDADAAQQAENTLRRMESLFITGFEDVRPNVASFCSVLNAWARCADSRGAQRAQHVLSHMEQLHAEGEDIKPDLICYNTVINAIARSRDQEAPQNAERLLLRLEELHRAGDEELRPDTVTYTSVINAASYATGSIGKRREAFHVAMRSFNKLCESKYHQPNHITYGTMLRAISNLAPMGESRDHILTTVFERCCSFGQVDTFVLKQLRNACTETLYHELLQENPEVRVGLKEQVRRIPPEWALK